MATMPNIISGRRCIGLECRRSAIKLSSNSAGLECVLSRCRTRSVFLTPICRLLIYHKSIENYIPSRLPSAASPTCVRAKGLTAESDLKHHACTRQLPINAMKSLFSSSIAILTGLLVLAWSFMLAETFTEGIRVSPETVSLKPGQYVWEPERAPEGPLLIVASIPEQVAYVYRNGVCIARSSVSASGVRVTLLPPAFSRFWKKRCIIPRVSTRGQRCLTWSASPGAGSRYMQETCQVTPIPMDVSGFRLNFPSCCSESR